MITIFNRRELFITYSMSKQSEIRTILAKHKIDYRIKTVNRKSSSSFSAGSRVRTGTFGEDTNLMLEYIIYVKKSDFDQAKYLIR